VLFSKNEKKFSTYHKTSPKAGSVTYV